MCVRLPYIQSVVTFGVRARALAVFPVPVPGPLQFPHLSLVPEAKLKMTGISRIDGFLNRAVCVDVDSRN